MKTILIVDDAKIPAMIIQRALGFHNFSFLYANSGAEGIETFKSNTVDLIMVDLVMPGMNGFEMVSKIRDFNDKVPIIAVAINIPENHRFNYQSKGFTDMIFLPPMVPCVLKIKVNTNLLE